MSAQASKGAGKALDASVSITPPDGEARQALLTAARGMEAGPAQDKLLELAQSLISPAETLAILADEAEAAAAAIKDKIKGMESTLQSKLDEAAEYRRQAEDWETDMAFAASAILREWPIQMFQVSGTGYTGLDSDTVNVALYNNTGTPDKDAAVANAAYNAGAWVTGNEVTDATNWVAGGRPLASKTFTTPATGVAMFDAADLAGGGNVTLSGVMGCLVYDNSITAGSVAKQGVCYNYFGGAQSVTAGTFTVVWNANGICRFTV